jgi:hypothetical protein
VNAGSSNEEVVVGMNEEMKVCNKLGTQYSSYSGKLTSVGVVGIGVVNVMGVVDVSDEAEVVKAAGAGAVVVETKMAVGAGVGILVGLDGGSGGLPGGLSGEFAFLLPLLLLLP